MKRASERKRNERADEGTEIRAKATKRFEVNDTIKRNEMNETNERTKEPIYERKKRDGDGVNETIRRT